MSLWADYDPNMTKLGIRKLEAAALPAAFLRRHPRELSGTLASHHPVICKPAIVTDYLVHGTAPVPGHYRPWQREAA